MFVVRNYVIVIIRTRQEKALDSSRAQLWGNIPLYFLYYRYGQKENCTNIQIVCIISLRTVGFMLLKGSKNERFRVNL